MTKSKKRLVSMLLVLVMVTAMLPSAFAVSTSDFKDVKPDGWYISAINYAVTKGLFEGTSGTTFEPDATMTKGMFVTVLSRMAGADTTNVPSAGLTDISGSEWYAGPANWAAGNGYAIRNENNRFRPEEPIAREEIADILTNYLTKTNTNTGTPTETVEAFADAASVSDWAVSAVEFMRSTGLMTGDENFNFNPQQYLTRAEAATVFMRIGERIGFEGKADDLFGWVELANGGYYEIVEGTYPDYLTDEATEYYGSFISHPNFIEDYPGYEDKPVKPSYRFNTRWPQFDKTAYDVEQHLIFTVVYQISLPDFNGKGEYIGSHEKDIESRTYPVTIVVRKDNSGSEGGGESGGGNGSETIDWAAASSEITEAFITTLNAGRAELGLSEVAVAAQDVMDYAVLRAEEQASLFGHTRPNGEMYYIGLRQLGYRRGSVENALRENGNMYTKFSAQYIADDFYDLWYNSQGHYDNMMSSMIKNVAIGMYSDGTYTYAIMIGVG